MTANHSISFDASARGLIGAPFGYQSLPVTNIVASMDMDRVPYCAAELTLEDVSPDVWTALDPRRPTVLDTDGDIRIRMVRRDAAGNAIDWLGQQDTPSTPERFCYLHTRSSRRDYVSGAVTVSAAGAESLLDDRRRISTTDVDTGATTVAGLVTWALTDTFGGAATTGDPLPYSAAIPTGDRRIMKPGITFNDLIEPEMDAIGCRLFNFWGRAWYLNYRDNPPLVNRVAANVALSTFTADEGAPRFADPIVFGIEQTVTRDGDYADGVLIRYDMTKSGGGVSLQRSGDGSNTKGRVITYERPAAAAGAADILASRTRIRGNEITLECSIRFDIMPGMLLTVYTRSGVLAGSIRAVTWDAKAGTMTIRAQSGRTVV